VCLSERIIPYKHGHLIPGTMKIVVYIKSLIYISLCGLVFKLDHLSMQLSDDNINKTSREDCKINAV